MSFCAVCGLRRTQATQVRLSVGFHQFPTEPVQRQAWEDFCCNGENKPNLPDYGQRTICSDHFAEECFQGGGKRVADPGKRHVLKKGAVPTLREGISLKKWQRRLEKRQQRSETNETQLTTESQILFAPISEPMIKPENVCRICASEDTLHDLSLGKNAEQARRFSALTSIEIDATAPWLCGGCLGRLNDAYEFVQACTEAEKRRKSLFVETLQIKQEEVQEVWEEPMVELEDDPAEQTKGEEDDEEDDSSEYEPEPSGPKVYTCETCQATFEKRTDLYAHVKTHGKSRFPCKLCDRSFARRYFLQVHMFSHTNEPCFSCERCSASFKCQSSLWRHQKTAHLGLKPFGCEECGKRFAQKTHLQAHAEVHVKEANMSCELCSMKFKTEFRLRTHVTTEHKDNQPLAPFECRICSKQFFTKQTLTTHMISHREPKLLCTVCGNKYRTNALLAAHMATHKPKSFSCELCPSMFSTKQLLQYHQQVHTDVKPFQCEQCPSAFKTIKSLKYHRLVHAGLKPFQCELCDRSFRCVAHLKTHQSVHTGAKPHECPVCHRGFAIKANMQLHMKVHTGGRKKGDDDRSEEELSSL